MHESVEPKITKQGDRTLYEHPAYGMLNFSRITTNNGIPLFGSSIKHGELIEMTVRTAEMERGFGHDYYHGRDTIVKCYMSYSQFAQAITTLNQEPGIPVTLSFVKDEGYKPECVFENKRIQLENRFKNHVDKTYQSAKILRDEIHELFDSKKALNKSEKGEILSRLDKIVQNMDENTAYIAQCFNEQVDATVTEAKAEIEAFVQNKMATIANNALLAGKDNPKDTNLFEPITMLGLEDKKE